jgi:hypothetical protein
MSEEGEVKKTSKLSSLISQAKPEVNRLQIIVHYSENNWETNEEINLILDENSTISQLIEETKAKLTNKQNIDKKVFNVRIFKKKKKIPNNEYPVCNLESKVKDYGKSHFCLVEDKQTSEINQKEEEKVEEKKEEPKEEKAEEKKEEIKQEEPKEEKKEEPKEEPKEEKKEEKKEEIKQEGKKEEKDNNQPQQKVKDNNNKNGNQKEKGKDKGKEKGKPNKSKDKCVVF